MSRRTVAVEVTQPVADVFRWLARDLEGGITPFTRVALRKFAEQMGVPEGPELRQRLAQKVRAFADTIEKGEL